MNNLKKNLQKIAALCLPLLLAACVSDDGAAALTIAPVPKIPTALKGFYAQQLEWKPCHTRLQCARFVVPLDYADPAGKTIDLAKTYTNDFVSAATPLSLKPFEPLRLDRLMSDAKPVALPNTT